ncbi:carboxymuconolactone decarboxylase [Pseudodesulfovibrio cashew]|uniref:Carboxymuconolactone decarboxylase n=2 Tax=Pseudodesulfovibrio cashew TaxID=2678688 RepID=A0A6I6JGH9_9BACT|nr:carboxymuconolactone decarboxylase family protein [Pseudodesulfovibrio cashew]QGY40269.1 carboxymuconolactone decarboxylase [Pseudodesulfovibrio cashew]
MRIKKLLPLLAALVLVFGFATITEASNMNKETTLDARQQAIVTIAAYTTSGDIEQLKPALNEGLDAGLTVNEVKEVLVQMYAYAGFPRSLGGIWAFMGVMDERKEKGIQDEEGKGASPIPADLDRDAYGERVRTDLSGLKEIPTTKAPYQEFSPIIDTFLKEHLFADIFARDILTHQERELATIACLASLGRAEGPLNFHMGAAMNTGLSEGQMHDFIKVLDARVGKKEAESAREVLASVLAARK